MNNKKDIRVGSILFAIQLCLFTLLVFADMADWPGINPTILFLTIFAALPMAYLIYNLRALRKPGKKLIPGIMVGVSGASFLVLVFIMIWSVY
jgi:hypothetical protein